MAMAASALHRTGAFVAPLVALVVVVSCGDTGGEGAQVIAAADNERRPRVNIECGPDGDPSDRGYRGLHLWRSVRGDAWRGIRSVLRREHGVDRDLIGDLWRPDYR